MHIPFVRLVERKFLAHFPVDHLAHPVIIIAVLVVALFVVIISILLYYLF